MSNLSWWKKACAVFVVCAATAIAARAQTFTTLTSFDSTDGIAPVGSLAQSTGGALYGSTYAGGAYSNGNCYGGSCGTVFEAVIPGQLTTLYNVCAQLNCADGATPFAGLVQATDENFYGTTVEGGEGWGTIFKMSPGGTLETLYNFCSQPDCVDGAAPMGSLIQGTDGSLYGTASQGGANSWGIVFKITQPGKLTILHNFAGRPNDGGSPRSVLIQASDGDFYGTTNQGGRFDSGTVFRMTPAGEVTTLYSFCAKPNCADGEFGDSGLVQASDGNLYGTTPYGGTVLNCQGYGNGCGTVFRITLTGKLTTLHSFGNSDGSYPYESMVRGTDGNLYGTTSEGGNLSCPPGYGYGCGTVFQINRQDVLTTLHSFDDADGSGPVGLIQGTNGKFYGATGGGGDSCAPYGCGTIYSLNMGLRPFVTFIVAGGKVGQTGPILGQGFTGTTGVSLNGIPADFTVVSDTFIRATVPSGATTGYVTVTTPRGTLTSNVPFRVIP
jgi:uncharacterized repeat protein (TIGR03803 family)